VPFPLPFSLQILLFSFRHPSSRITPALPSSQAQAEAARLAADLALAHGGRRAAEGRLGEAEARLGESNASVADAEARAREAEMRLAEADLRIFGADAGLDATASAAAVAEQAEVHLLQRLLRLRCH
jgi:hypothetical protein